MRVTFLGEEECIHLRRHVDYFLDRGWEVDVLTFKPVGVIGAAGVRTIEIPQISPHVRGVSLLAKVAWLHRYAREQRPDIFHAHYVTVYGLLPVLAGLRPLVVSAHGSDVLLAKESLWNRQVIRWVGHRADAITSPAAHVTRIMAELGVAQTKIVTRQYGIDERMFRPNGSGRGDKAGLYTVQEGVRVVATRPHKPIYDLATLVRAAGLLHGDAADLRYRLIGDGPERLSLEAMARGLGLAERFRFDGTLGRGALARCLRDADLYVTPALSDGASLSLLEAMASGLCPVATDIEANREWLREGENGFLFTPGNPGELARAIRRAIDARERWSSIAEHNRRIIEQRALFRKNMPKLEALYHALRGLRERKEVRSA